MFSKNSYFIILSVIVICFVNKSDCAIGDKIKPILLDFQKRMCHPIPSKGLPTLDPFEYDEFKFNLSEKRLGHLNGTVWRVKLTNLSDFIIHKLDVRISLKFEVNISIPLLEVKTAYRADGIISDLFPINGLGFLLIRAHNASLHATGQIASDENSKIIIRNLKISPKVVSLSGTLGRITPEDEVNKVFDSVVNEKGSEIVDTIWNDYEDETIKTIYKMVKDLDMDLSVITSSIENDKPIFPETDPKPTCKDKNCLI